MIDIQRKFSPLDAYAFAEFFVGEINCEKMGDELYKRMVRASNDTLVLAAHEFGELIGFMVAWTIPDRDYVWVDQCWYRPDLQETPKGDKVMQQGMKKLKLWALGHGKKKLRMQTPRSAKAWSKKWGFNEIMSVMQKDINYDE